MLHAVAGTIVGGEVDEERIFFKLRRSPHRDFGAHDLLDVFDECRASPSFWSKRVDHDVILFPVNFEVVLSPVRSDLGGCIDHDVPVWKLPFGLTGSISAAVHDSPAGGRLDLELHRIRFMVHDVHEDRAAVVVRVTVVEL